MADQLTPRVVRTVEELRAGMVLRDANGCVGEVFMALGRLEFSRTNGGSTTLVATDRSLFPATILAPLSVTAEQVEAGIAEFVEVWNEGMQADYPEGVYPSERECMAAGFTAALAAMGIPVVDGE